jgi:hypothetical protein
MPRGKSDNNTGILEYALRHLEKEREDLQEKIDHIRRQLGIRLMGTTAASAPAAASAAASSAATPSGRAKRVLSAAARKRIAAAQRKRWAEHRKSLKTTAKKSE